MTRSELNERDECYRHLADLIVLILAMKDQQFTKLKNNLIVNLPLTTITKLLGRGNSMKDSVRGTIRISNAKKTYLNSREIMPLYCYRYNDMKESKHLSRNVNATFKIVTSNAWSRSLYKVIDGRLKSEYIDTKIMFVAVNDTQDNINLSF